MKTFLILIIIMLLCSCQFNQSVKKDFMTGAYTRGDGIGCDDITIKINNKVKKDNEFNFGDKATFIFNNIEGLKRIDNKVYPGISMHILKNEKDTVLAIPNLMKNPDEGNSFSVLQIQAKFNARLPYQNNEKYKVVFEIWDEKGDGKFNYELPFTVKNNGLLSIKNEGFKYSVIYLWNTTLNKLVSDNNLSRQNKYAINLEDIEGLKEYDGNLFPIFSLEIVDNEGKKIISEPNLYSDYIEKGVSPELIKDHFYIKFHFGRTEISNPCRLIGILKDKHSTNQVQISAKLNIH